ncbi:MAG: DinB family protein [Pyrinomonadaceae bacterium]|nr:DinB family protein [Pyrinomonadaceae bacterium]
MKSEKAFSQEMAFADKDLMLTFLNDFKNTIETAEKRLLSISEQESQIPRAEGKWSPKEIIGHLIDSATNNHQRFVRAQFDDQLSFSGYEQEEWVRVQGYNQESWRQLVQLWKHYNLHLVHVMSMVPEQTRTKPRSTHNLDQIAWKTIAKNETVTLDYFMRDYVAHMKNHLGQITDA